MVTVTVTVTATAVVINVVVNLAARLCDLSLLLFIFNKHDPLPQLLNC